MLRIGIPSLMFAITVGTDTVQNLLTSIPDVITGGVNVAGGMIVVVGYAMVINMMKTGALMPFLYLGFVIAAFTEFHLVALGVIGVILAILYLQLHPQFNQRSEEHTSELQSRGHLVCRLLF